MTPRQGLWMVFVGFVILVASAIPAYVILETAPGTPGGASELVMNSVILLYAGGFVGLVVMAVGLILAAVGALTKQSGKPS